MDIFRAKLYSYMQRVFFSLLTFFLLLHSGLQSSAALFTFENTPYKHSRIQEVMLENGDG